MCSFMSGASKLDILRMYSLLSHIASINRATVTRPAPSQQMLWDNKKNEGGISRARVNPVSWITNPASHTPVSNSISYFIRGCLVILFNLYNRPSEIHEGKFSKTLIFYLEIKKPQLLMITMFAE
jgi:hypothetical protein